MRRILRKITVCLTAVILTAIIPFSVSATEAIPYSLTVQCKVGGAVPQNTEFKFEVTTADITFSDNEDDESYNLTNTAKLNDFVINTKTNADGSAKYDFGSSLTNNKYFCFKLISCSDKTAVIGDLKIEVKYYNANTFVTDVEKDGQHIEDLTFAGEPAVIPIDLTKASAITFTTDGCEPITKAYDGNLNATVTDKNFKLLGVAQGDDVKVTFEKAEYNNADVKKATKVKLSGLKLSGNSASKYTLAKDSVDLKAVITPMPITVTADSITMTQGQAEPILTYKVSNELALSSATGALARTPGTEIGSYTVTLGTLSFGDNFAVTFQEGVFTVSSFSKTEIKDSATSIIISGHLAPDSTVTANALDPQGNAYSALAGGTGWGEILSTFEVKLVGNYEGQLAISFPVDQAYEGKEIAVYQYGNNGAVICYKPVVSGGKITVTTDKATQFMLVGEKNAQDSEEGSVAWTILKILLIILAVIVGLALIIVLFFFLMIFFNKTEQLKSIIRVFKNLLGK